MKVAYGYEVVSRHVSLWMSDGTRWAMPEAGGDIGDDGDAVVEIVIRREGPGFPPLVERFFLESELEAVLPLFLSHYGIDPARPEQMAAVEIVRGRLLSPAPPAGSQSDTPPAPA